MKSLLFTALVCVAIEVPIVAYSTSSSGGQPKTVTITNTTSGSVKIAFKDYWNGPFSELKPGVTQTFSTPESSVFVVDGGVLPAVAGCTYVISTPSNQQTIIGAGIGAGNAGVTMPFLVRVTKCPAKKITVSNKTDQPVGFLVDRDLSASVTLAKGQSRTFDITTETLVFFGSGTNQWYSPVDSIGNGCTYTVSVPAVGNAGADAPIWTANCPK